MILKLDTLIGLSGNGGINLDLFLIMNKISNECAKRFSHM